MRYIGINEVATGMRLGSDVYDAFGRILLEKSETLSSEYIERLRELGFEGVYISDPLSTDITIEPMISPMLRGRGINCVRNMDIDGCILVAKEMVSDILNQEEISLDLIDLREGDDLTYAHSVNVALYSCVIGLGLNLSEKELEMLALAGLVHDFGKISLPPELTEKSHRLTQEEYQVIKSHVKLGYDILKPRTDIPSEVKMAVLMHHENVDGSGYPQGVNGDEIPLFAKIIHIADVYDALVSKRAYKSTFSAYEASEYLIGARGIMFESMCLSAFLKFLPLYPKGIEMKLSNGERCIVVDNSGRHNIRPIVRLLNGETINLGDMKYTDLTLESVDKNKTLAPINEKERQEMVKPFHKYKILVVDDMMTNLQLIRGILEYHYDVTLVKSGKQALTFLSKNPAPDVIIMDIDMPDMDGIETARQINENQEEKIPILFVTTISNRDTILECQNIGAAGYIIRPYKPIFIRSELKRILTGRGDAE